MKHQLIVIIDCGSQYTQLIARRVRESGVYCEVVSADTSAESIYKNNPVGIIVSGSPDSTTDADSSIDRAIIHNSVPVLGICFGMQLLLNVDGNSVDTASSGEFGPMQVVLAKHDSTLFTEIADNFTAWMSHSDKFSEIVEHSDYRVIATSADGIIAAVEHKTAPIYAVQFHPEVEHTDYGIQLIKNFTHRICGCTGDWQLADIVTEKVALIRDQVQQDNVLLALSGGVDSSVVAALLHKAIGTQLTAVFIDNGLLREGESEQVRKTFEQDFAIDLRVIDAKERFFHALANIEDPEQKRKVIGKTFINIFEEEAKKVKDCRWLAQGTIYPDVIESADSNASAKAKVIKSHHNVGGLPANMQLQLVEPIRDLFKDEVRRLGEQLGLPRESVYRHPFPGPGLAVRVLGKIEPEFVTIARSADAIFIEQLRKYGYYDKVSQAFVVFLPIKSVGVKGDNRAYEYVVSLRAVETIDFMTATAAKLPHDFLQEVATKILNQVAGVTRVCYDISSKPPSTIEWE